MINEKVSNEKVSNNKVNDKHISKKYLLLGVILALGLLGGSVALALQISLDSPATLPSDI